MSYENLPCKGKFCGRPGLPLLPLRVAYVPDGENDLPDGVYASPDLHLNPLNAGRYMLRTITEGYVFLWDERFGWRAFGATPSGKFKSIPIADNERPTEAPKFACAREGHNLEASLINIQSPHRIDGPEQVWIGYARSWWTRSVRRKLAGDRILRMRTMVQVDAKAVHGGAHPNSEVGFKVDQAGQKLADHVLEYRDHARASRLYANTKTVPSPGSSGAEPVLALDRTGEAAAQAEKMYELSEHGGIALALRDPVGIVQDIAAWRNHKAGLLAEYKLQQENMREQVVADLVGGIKGQLDDAGQTSEWFDRYDQHVDLARVRRIRNEHQVKLKELEEPILAIARDWSMWFQSTRLWSVLDTYDGEDRKVADDLEKDCADCIDGAGALKSEQMTMDRVLGEPPDGEYRALWLAFAAGNQDLVKFLTDKIGPKDTFSLAKDAREIGIEFKKWINEQRAAGNLGGATVSAAIIGRTLASQLVRMLTEQPGLAPVLGTRITIVAAARMNIVITPYSYTSTAQAMVFELYEAAWESSSDPMATIRVDRTFQRSEQSLRGSWISTQIEAETRIQMTAWVPESQLDDLRPATAALAGGGLLGGSGASPALPGPAATPYQGLTKWVKTLDAKLVGLGGVLTVANLAGTLQEYIKADAAGDAAAKRKAMFGVVSGVMGVGAVVADAAAGIYASRVTPAVAKSAAARMFIRAGVARLAGGVLAAGASFSEGIYLFSKSVGLERQGNTDASWSYQMAGSFYWVSGVTAVATALIGAKSLLVAAGITASSGGVLGGIVATGGFLAFIPVWGWIALGIAALAAGLYFWFSGKEEEDTELEIWMSRCYLRDDEKYAGSNRARYENLEEELSAFQDAIYGLKIEFEWNEEFGRDRLKLHVILPGYDDRSVHAYSLMLGNARTRITVDRETHPSAADPDLRPQPPAQAQVSAAPEQSWLERQAAKIDARVAGKVHRSGWEDAWRWMRDKAGVVESADGSDEMLVRFRRREGFAELSAELLIDEDFFQQAILKMEYWPDALQLPQLKMTSGRNGVNYRLERRN